jgi:DNA-binding CsgD family transcriptional regulator
LSTRALRRVTASITSAHLRRRDQRTYNGLIGQGSHGQGAVLRPREREVLALVASGRTSAAIATQLHLSRNTVESHIRNAVDRLGAANRTHAVVMALGRGEIALPDTADPGA